MTAVPRLIKGGLFSDNRGSLSFVNDFFFQNVKRFYQISNSSTAIIRAWQGHKTEHKYFYAATGSFIIAWVKPDDWESPSPHLVAEHVVLNAKEPSILSIPPGYANGIRSIKDNASLIIFSDLSIEESTLDRWSFDSHLWFDWEQHTA
jgi:dTDP-4-dehydrorhamnose 3,5-epimerase